MGETRQQILWIVIGAIIFMIVYTLWTNPSMIMNIFDKIENSAKIGEESQVTEDPLLKSCLEEVKKNLEILKERSIFPVSVYIKEYKQFNGTEEAIEYLKEWRFDLINLWRESSYPDLYDYKNGKYDIIEHDNPIIVLIKGEMTIELTKTQIFAPLICIGGKLTENSKESLGLVPKT